MLFKTGTYSRAGNLNSKASHGPWVTQPCQGLELNWPGLVSTPPPCSLSLPEGNCSMAAGLTQVHTTPSSQIQAFISWLTLTANTLVCLNSEMHLKNKHRKPHGNHPKFVINRSDTNQGHRYPVSTLVCIQINSIWFKLKFIYCTNKVRKRQPWTFILI